jgi:hypothetical protein
MLFFTYQLKANPDGSLSGPAGILPANSVTGIRVNGNYYGKASIGSISILTNAGFQANVLNSAYQYVMANAANGVITGVERRADHLLITNNSANTANTENIAFTAYTTWISEGKVPLPPAVPYETPDYEGFSSWLNNALSVVNINTFCAAYPGFAWFVMSHNNAGISAVLIDAFNTGKITAGQLLAVKNSMIDFNIPIVLP